MVAHVMNAVALMARAYNRNYPREDGFSSGVFDSLDSVKKRPSEVGHNLIGSIFPKKHQAFLGDFK